MDPFNNFHVQQTKTLLNRITNLLHNYITNLRKIVKINIIYEIMKTNKIIYYHYFFFLFQLETCMGNLSIHIKSMVETNYPKMQLT